MSSITMKWNQQNQWIFPQITPTEEDIKIVIAIVTSIAVRISFENFSHKFGGKFYRQKSGSPIGVRATGAASQLVMEDWAAKYKKILLDSGLLVKLLAGYVDDESKSLPSSP